MTRKIEILAGKDYDELMEMLDSAFGFNVQNGFKTFLPKLYRPAREPWKYNYGIRDEKSGKLVCALGVYPMTLSVNGQKLLCHGYGNMGVDRNARGQGLMSSVMQYAVDESRKAGCDFAFLGGKRQRYATFGFEPAGKNNVFLLTDSNFKHCFGDIPNDVKVRKLTEDDPALDVLIAIYNSKPLHTERKKEIFYDILTSWNYEPYVAYRDGKPLGYYLRKESEIRELILQNDEDLFPVLRSARFENENLLVEIDAFDKNLCLLVSKIAESYRIEQWEKFEVFRFLPVLRAFLTLQDSAKSLPDGIMTVKIDRGESSETVRITVRDGVAVAEESTGKPDLILSYADAMAFFFSDFSRERETCRNSLHRLFPLPLSMRKSDHT